MDVSIENKNKAIESSSLQLKIRPKILEEARFLALSSQWFLTEKHPEPNTL